MRKTITVLLAAALVTAAFLALAADAAKKKKKPKKVSRTITHTYQAPSPGVAGTAGFCLAAYAENQGCTEVPLSATEKFASVTITDATGQKVAGTMSQNTEEGGTGGYEIIGSFCGSTDKPVAVTPGLPLRISVYAVSSSACPGVSTNGSFKVTVSNLS